MPPSSAPPPSPTDSVVGTETPGPGALAVAFASGARLRLDALSDAVLRLRWARPGGGVRETPSYALDPDARWDGPMAWATEETDGDVRVTTSSLVLSCNNGTVTLEDRAGRTLLAGDGATWDGGAVAHGVRLDAGDRLLGLGDKALGLDRRGHAVEMWNTDAFKYGRGTDPLYKSVPFVLKLAPSGAAVGLFYDNTFRSRFDLGASREDRMRYEAEGGDLDLYVLTAESPLGVVRAFARLTGRTPMLPRWALGYHQSRYSYETEAEVREVARELRQRGIPCDAIYLDIHYMRGYRVFTWDRDRFPNASGLTADLHADGFHTVAIVDPGVKADDPDYGVYAEGAALDAYVKNPDGTEAHGEVWPGLCAFPDFTRADVRAWWGGLHTGLVSDGVDGVWNDMNEPAVFAKPFEEGQEDVEGEAATLDDDARHALEGRGGTHAEAHNVYGMQMQRSTFEGLGRLRPGRRPFTITRAAYAGGQRFGTGWTGDNSSTWDHLRLAVETVLSLGVSGMPVTGADVGGFVGAPSAELLVRWTQAGAVTPFFRNHTALGTPRQEPWAFGAETERVCREAIEWRYRLLPVLYTALWEAATEGTPILRPLGLVHPESAAAGAAAFYVGADVLAAPVVEEGARAVPVPFPDVPGGWTCLHTGRRYAGGETVTVEAPLSRLPLFVRGGSVVPLGPVVQHTGERAERLALHVTAAPGRTESRLYWDAGDGHGWERGDHWLGRFTVEDDGQALRVGVSVTGSHVPPWTAWDVVVHGLGAAPARVATASGPAEAAWDGRAVRLSVGVGEGFALATAG